MTAQAWPTLDDVVGQPRAVGILRRSIASDRVGGAYLFAGPEGAGKLTAARAFVADLFCHERGEAPGDASAVFRKLRDGNHADFFEFGPDGPFVKVDQIREMREAASLAPFEANRKAFVLGEAERMNPAASNAFLKVLEEPPGRSLFILVTSAPQRLLPTIRSRCQMIAFGISEPGAVADVLVDKRGLTRNDALIVARLSGGSIGRAMAIPDEVLAARREVGRVFFSLVPGRDRATRALAQILLDWPEGVDNALDMIKTFVADAMRHLAGAPASELTHADLAGEAAAFADRFEPAILARKSRAVTYTQRLLARNVNRQLAIETMLFELASPRGSDYGRRMPR
ncbi:DNA polymerase III subunit delta' [bacterium]|nr:DNA polymerase III subunit delta' [bacterium]